MSEDNSSIGIKIGQKLRRAGMTQTEIAARFGISQSQVSRIFSGKVTRRTESFDALLLFADRISPDARRRSPRTNDTLMQALADVWDGSEAHASAIARVIRSLRAFPRKSESSRR
ncbi:helix-turn-helix domain-containing protein [Pandoraea pneumonica]|uniref:helix-turn-helix domain-containing protein n=1 Tax=Pandoraea pneumonica TaxID=2508299 RepID=UPI00124068AF